MASIVSFGMSRLPCIGRVDCSVPRRTVRCPPSPGSNVHPCRLNQRLNCRGVIGMNRVQQHNYCISTYILCFGGASLCSERPRLQVFADGVEQAVTVTGEADGQFDPADAVGFYGRGVDTAYTDIRVYWVVAGAQPGLRIQAATPPPAPRARASGGGGGSSGGRRQRPAPTAAATPPPTAPVTSPPTATPTPRPAAPVTPARAAPPTVTATATPTPTPPATPAPAPAATARPMPAPAPAATAPATPQRPQRRRPTPEPAAAPVTTPGNSEPVAPVTESTPARALMPVFPAVDAVARERPIHGGAPAICGSRLPFADRRLVEPQLGHRVVTAVLGPELEPRCGRRGGDERVRHLQAV